MVIELKSGKTRISAPAHPSATDGRVSSLVHLRPAFTAVRVKRVLDRKRLSRIGGDVASRRVDDAIGSQHKRLKVTSEVHEAEETG